MEPRLLLSLAPQLEATGASNQEIDLNWTAATASATQQVVERSQGDGPFIEVATVPPAATTYRDLSLPPVTAYRYRLREDVTSGGEIYSYIATASTLPVQTTTTVTTLPPVLVEGSSDPRSIVASGPIAYFSVTSQSGSTDLWRTDGTESGTFWLNVPGRNPAPPNQLMVNVGGTLFYVLDNQLWKSDGTLAGTTMVASVYDTPASIGGLADFHNTLYFVAGGYHHGAALWTSDGTAAGTKVVRSLPPDTSSAEAITVSGDRMFFISEVVENYGTERHLWVSDGTAAGTNMVSVSDAAQLFPSDGNLFFTGYDFSSHYALGFTDGLSTNELLSDSTVNLRGSLIQPAYLGHDLYLLAPSSGTNPLLQLWKSGGTVAGTTLVVTLSDAQATAPLPVYAGAGRLYFSTEKKDGSGADVWVSDGTAMGTSILKSVAGGSPASGFTALNGAVYFDQSDPKTGPALWKTDGTVTGTTPVRTFAPTFAIDPGDPRNLTVFGSLLLFSADDGTHGRELWETDGTAAGTSMVKDIAYSNVPVEPNELTSAGGEVFFEAADSPRQARARSLWTSDGTPAGTSIVYPGEISGVFSANGTAYFIAGSPYKPGPLVLEKTDGTTAGTVPITTIAAPGIAGVTPFGSTGNKFFFGIGITNHPGYDLWVSDGTTAGTHLVNSDPFAGEVGYGPATPIISGGFLYYVTNQGSVFSWQLWRTDGTAAGTVKVADIPSSTAINPNGLADVNGGIFFATEDMSFGHLTGASLWEYDAAAATLVHVQTFAGLGPITNLNGTAFFLADDGTHGWQLWKSDGTPQGTTPIVSIAPIGMELFVSNGLLYFKGQLDGAAVLYRSDGTSGGTFPVHVYSPTANSGPMPLWDAQAALFFRDGQELWATDGTEAGSRMVDGNYSYDDLFNFYAGPLGQAVGDRFYYSSGNDLRFASMAPLSAPTALTAQTTFAGAGTAPAVTLAWVGAWPDAAGFIIERSTHSDFATIDRSDFVPVGMQTFTDTSPTTAPAYYYRLRAIDAAGESQSSNTAIARFAVISGSVFNDMNHNGNLDPGEAGLAGVRVYVDAEDSGHLGPNDVYAITDPSGSYVLGGLGPGYYTIREVLPVGFGQTAPETYSGIVTATLGQAAAVRERCLVVRADGF